MKDLKNLNHRLAAIRKGQAELAAKLGDLSAEKFELESEARDKAAAVEAADVALVASLAAAELGEQTDTASARKALDDAKAQASMVGEAATRLRVLDALKARHEAEHTALHERGLGVMDAIQTAEAERLRALIREYRENAASSIREMARAESLLRAAIEELNARGVNNDLAPISEQAVIVKFQASGFNPRAEVLAALTA